MNKNMDWLKPVCGIAGVLGYFSISIFGIHPLTIASSMVILGSIIGIVGILSDKRKNTKIVICGKVVFMFFVFSGIFLIIGVGKMNLVYICLAIVFFIAALLVAKIAENSKK